MKCLFCPEQDIRAYKEESAIKNRLTCDTCKTVFEFKDDEIERYYYGVMYKETMYVVYVSFDDNLIGMKRFNIIDQETRSVMELDYVPDNITPHNLADKLPTILTFS